ncbi:FUSC family protein [Sphingomonas sp. TDK1]|uniref:FUSC family protein n=1 Tax=Sphingomonas sp. TDK1 TaxID=453247 RepID=UPI000AAD8B97|nr:FUSC family protein [Sphingomonas sp. TDK1]
MGIWLFYTYGWVGPRLTLPPIGTFLRAPALRADAEALLFSAKTFAAAMLAYYIALRIGLPRPSWAIITAYLVSQGSAGASLSRGVYRMVGTLIGAAATVVILPTFVAEPIICSLVLAGWIGFCLFLSLLDRTPRAYAFVLAGYTASLIGFPAVAEPDAIFDTALVRVQEIGLGILCAVLIHRFLLPRPMTGQLVAKVTATLRDARRLAGDLLRGETDPRQQADRHRLALDLLALNGLAMHLPYDPAIARPRRATLRHLHDRLARLLPLATEIEARLAAIHDDEALAALRHDIGQWIDAAPSSETDATAPHLIDRANQLRAETYAEPAQGGQLLAGNLAGHLAELVRLLHEGDLLGREVANARPARNRASRFGGMPATGYVHHRDPLMAARAAIGATLGILAGCLLWIWSAWPDGGLAVSVLGVTCALFGNVDAPAPNVRKYMLGSLYGVVLSLAYSFIILPRVTDFPMLVVVLAPAFLWGGSLQPRPATAYMALGITLTIPILSGLGAQYSADFADALNGSVALFVATGFGAASMTLLQTVPADAAIDRLLWLSRRDVARRARGHGPAEAGWTSLMVDRTALQLPRLAASTRLRADTLDAMLRYLRIGHAVARLHRALVPASDAIDRHARQLLGALAEGLANSRDDNADAVAALHQRLETLIARVAADADEGRLRLLDPLLDLRFALAATTDPQRAA